MSEVEKKLALLILPFSALLFIFWPPLIGISFLVGGLLAFFNLRMLRKKVEMLIRAPDEERSNAGLVFTFLKYPLLLGLIGFIVLKTSLRPEIFTGGFLMLVPAVLWEGLWPVKAMTIGK